MDTTTSHRIEGRLGSDAERRRLTWGENLGEAMRVHDLTVKGLHRALTEVGVAVTPQAIYSWRSGVTAPTPEHQAAVAAVLRMPVGLLFPVKASA